MVEYNVHILITGSDNMLDDLLEDNYGNINSYFNKIIFSLYLFIKKLTDELIKNDYKEVFFLAREGEYLKRLFDYYNKYNGNKIKSNYLYVSRKSTYIASLKNINKENFSYLLKQYRTISIREFLGSLNFDDKEINIVRKKYKYDIDIKIDSLISSKELMELKSNKEFINIYESKRLNQKELFNRYIKQLSNKKKIMVVDIGWNGSIQDNIQNILGDEYIVNGCYFGLVLRDNKYNKNKKGLVFSNYPQESNNYKLYYENRTIYEIILGASHGSAAYYYLNNDKVEAKLFNKQEELDIYNNIVHPAQEDMFKVFKKICEIKRISDKDINRIHYNLVFKPNKEQLEFFDKMYHYENFGVFEFTTFNDKNRFNLYKIVKEHAKYVLKNKTYFEDCFWPVLKLYNNKMYLPYLIYRNNKYKEFIKKGLI